MERVLADGCIPFVYDHDEGLPRMFGGVHQHFGEAICAPCLWVRLHEFFDESPFQVRDHSLAAGTLHSCGHVHVYDVESVQIGLVSGCRGEFQALEQLSGIARAVIVCAKHLRGERLAKSPWSAHADELPGSPDDGVDAGCEPRLIDVFAACDLSESGVSRVQIQSHCRLRPRSTCKCKCI